jgi:hypothetical protein
MFGVCVERRLPRRLLGRGRDLNRSGQLLHTVEDVVHHVTDGSIRRQRHDPQPAVDVLHDCLVATLIERDPNPPEPFGAERRRVSQPRTVSRSAECRSCGSGGARFV